MIFILEGSQRRKLRYYFDRMFKLRHQVFIKELGWNLPKCHADFEIDEYDVDEAIYLLDSGFSARIPDPPEVLPATAKGPLEKAVHQIRQVGRKERDWRFLVLEHNEDQSGRDALYLRLTVPLSLPSDYFSLDEFRDFGFKIPTSGQP